MKLWLVKARDDLPKDDNPWDPWYDKNFGFVIRAETAEQARIIAQENTSDEGRIRASAKEYGDGIPWLHEKYSTCEELLSDGQEGLIIQDFHAA
jgi:hypothetical protein